MGVMLKSVKKIDRKTYENYDPSIRKSIEISLKKKHCGEIAMLSFYAMFICIEYAVEAVDYFYIGMQLYAERKGWA